MGQSNKHHTPTHLLSRQKACIVGSLIIALRRFCTDPVGTTYRITTPIGKLSLYPRCLGTLYTLVVACGKYAHDYEIIDCNRLAGLEFGLSTQWPASIKLALEVVSCTIICLGPEAVCSSEAIYYDDALRGVPLATVVTHHHVGVDAGPLAHCGGLDMALYPGTYNIY